MRAGKIPALEHGELQLFETDAIAQYLITAFGRPDLLPTDATARARCIQSAPNLPCVPRWQHSADHLKGRWAG